MTRPVPLFVLLFFLIWLSTQIGTTGMWILCVVFFAALIALIIVLRYKDMFVGPKTIADEFTEATERFLRDERGETGRLERRRIEREMEEDFEDEFEEVEENRPAKRSPYRADD